MSQPETSNSIPKSESVIDPLEYVADPLLAVFLEGMRNQFPKDVLSSVSIRGTFISAMPQLYGEVERSPEVISSLFTTMYKRILPLMDHDVILPGETHNNRVQNLSQDDMLTALSYLWTKEIMDKNSRRVTYPFDALKIASGMWGDEPRAKKMDKAADLLREEHENRAKSAREKANYYNHEIAPRFWWHVPEEGAMPRLPQKLQAIDLEAVRDMIKTCEVVIANKQYQLKPAEIDLYFFKIDREVLNAIRVINEVNRLSLGVKKSEKPIIVEFREGLKVCEALLTKYGERIKNLDQLVVSINSQLTS